MALPYDSLQLIRSDGVQLLDIVGRHDPATPVPSCPDWSLHDLAAHIGGVWGFWARIVEEHMTDLDMVRTISEPPVLEGDALLEWVTASHTALYGALVDARPEREVWTWTGSNQPVEWVRRRMAQETAVHSWDAARAVGEPDDIEAVVAADGVDEFLTYFLTADESPSSAGTLTLSCSDTAGKWTTPASGTAGVRATANDLLLWLWKRPGITVAVDGDAGAVEQFRAALRG